MRSGKLGLTVCVNHILSIVHLYGPNSDTCAIRNTLASKTFRNVDCCCSRKEAPIFGHAATGTRAFGAAAAAAYLGPLFQEEAATNRTRGIGHVQPPDGLQGWTVGRQLLATLLRQGNTYATWSLALRSKRRRRHGGSARPTVTPADLGVTSRTSLKQLKRLDLGGRDQRQMMERLDANDRPAPNLFPDGTHCHVLTGGTLETRLERRRRLSD